MNNIFGSIINDKLKIYDYRDKILDDQVNGKMVLSYSVFDLFDILVFLFNDDINFLTTYHTKLDLCNFILNKLQSDHLII